MLQILDRLLERRLVADLVAAVSPAFGLPLLRLVDPKRQTGVVKLFEHDGGIVLFAPILRRVRLLGIDLEVCIRVCTLHLALGGCKPCLPLRTNAGLLGRDLEEVDLVLQVVENLHLVFAGLSVNLEDAVVHVAIPSHQLVVVAHFLAIPGFEQSLLEQLDVFDAVASLLSNHVKFCQQIE